MKSRRIYKEPIIKTESNINSKIPYSNKEEINKFKSTKQYKTEGNLYHSTRMIKLTRKDIEKLKKLQKWWKRILTHLNPYRKSQKIFLRRNNDNMQEKYSSNSSSNDLGKNKYDYKNRYRNSSTSNSSLNTNINTYSNNTYNNKDLKKAHYSKSYTNLNTNTYNSYNPYNNSTSNKKNYYIQNMTRKTEATTNPQYAGSLSTSPSNKSKYLVETRKIEIYKKQNNSDNKPYSKSSLNSFISFSEISKNEVKNMMKNIWNEESFCSTVESLSCISNGKNNNNISNNSSQNNTIILEEYEEEIHKLRKLLVEKEYELNNINNKNKTWNEINIPSPINEIHIESFKNSSQSEINYIDIENKEKQEILRGNISNNSVEDVLEIQEINALSIISNKNRYIKNICQHLQSLSILSNKNYNKSNLTFQKIEEINITSIISSSKYNNNKIQELDGIQILNMNNNELKRKNKLLIQKLDRIFIRCFSHNNYNMIQELDGLEILKQEKQVKIFPQCVDELLIKKQYDKPSNIEPLSKELKIQGSGLNILSLGKNKELQNQQMDKFNIEGLPKFELDIQSQDKITLLKNDIFQNINYDKNILEKIDNIELKGKNNDWNKIIKPIKATKLKIKSDIDIDINKIKIPKKIIQKEKIETVERIYLNKNWNGIIKPIKTTKLNIKGIKYYNIWDNLNIEERDNIYINDYINEKEELIIESFAFNLTENNKQFRDQLFIENNGFDLINNKIKKEQILLPSQCEQINFESLVEYNADKIELLKMIKENYLFIKGKNKIIEKEINLNKNKPFLIKQTSDIISLTGLEKPQPKIILVQKNWNNLLRGQKSGKFCLLGKEKIIKKNKLLVANGDKFFIQKELDDEIIFNDDYNSRKEKLKEKVIIPKYQREIRAQIAKVKEISESDSSSLGELDVLEGIKNKKYLSNNDNYLKNATNGYEMKMINGEVIYTAKNKIGDNLNINSENNINDNFKKTGKKKQIIINNFRISKTLENINDINDNNINMNGQNIINDDILMSPRFPKSENIINISDTNNSNKKGQVIFNPKFTTIKSRYSTRSFNIPRSGNIIMNSRKENEKQLLNEKKNGEQIIKIKRSKVKNVELLRDYDSQYSF